MALPDDLAASNERYATSFGGAGLPKRPARRLAVLTCMDARLDPHAFLGLRPGDAHVISNAGGRASDDAIRSLAVSTHLLGVTRILVIHHTDCGMQGVSNEELRQRLSAEGGVDAAGMDLLPFDDLEGSVRDDVRALAGHALLAGGFEVSGFVFDVATGRLRHVIGPLATRAGGAPGGSSGTTPPPSASQG